MQLKQSSEDFGVDSKYDMKLLKHFIQELHDPTEHFLQVYTS